MRPHIKLLRYLGACKSAINFAKKYPTLEAAWDECENPHWMSLLLSRAGQRPDKFIRKMNKVYPIGITMRAIKNEPCFMLWVHVRTELAPEGIWSDATITKYAGKLLKKLYKCPSVDEIWAYQRSKL